MVDIETFRQMALSLPETIEQPHFEKTSFRVHNKIFATLDIQSKIACLKLSETEQNMLSAINSGTIFPVHGKWGRQGWTNMLLDQVREDICVDAISSAYFEVLKKSASSKAR